MWSIFLAVISNLGKSKLICFHPANLAKIHFLFSFKSYKVTKNPSIREDKEMGSLSSSYKIKLEYWEYFMGQNIYIAKLIIIGIKIFLVG